MSGMYDIRKIYNLTEVLSKCHREIFFEILLAIMLLVLTWCIYYLFIYFYFNVCDVLSQQFVY